MTTNFKVTKLKCGKIIHDSPYLKDFFCGDSGRIGLYNKQGGVYMEEGNVYPEQVVGQGEVFQYVVTRMLLVNLIIASFISKVMELLYIFVLVRI